MKKFFMLLSIALLFSVTIGVGTPANANSDFQLTPEQEKKVDEVINNLTPEQEKKADEMVKELERFEKLTSHLKEDELNRLFEEFDYSNNGSRSMKLAKEPNDIVIAKNQEEVNILNEQLRYSQQPELPKDTVLVTFKSDDSFVATTQTGEELVMPAGFWGTTWQVAKCAGHLTLVAIPGGAAFKAIKSLGGMKKTAQLLIGAGNAKDFVAIAGGAASTILGLDGIYENCFKW